MKTLVLLIAAAVSANAQVSVACSPQPMASTSSIAEKAMGQWACWVTNDGATPYVLTPSRLYAAVIELRPISPAVATQILTDAINHLPQSKFVKIGQVAIALAGIGATVYTGNAQWSLIGGIVGQNAPKAIQVIANEIPSAAPFIGGQLTGPVTLVPGADLPAPIVVYAAKRKAADLKPLVVKL